MTWYRGLGYELHVEVCLWLPSLVGCMIACALLATEHAACICICATTWLDVRTMAHYSSKQSIKLYEAFHAIKLGVQQLQRS